MTVHSTRYVADDRTRAHRPDLLAIIGVLLLLLGNALQAGEATVPQPTLGKDAGMPGAPAVGQPAGNRINPVISIETDQPILVQATPPALTRTNLSVKTWQFPENAKLSFQWRQIQDEMHRESVKISQAPIRFSSTTTQRIEAILPAPGVYTVAVTVTDSANQKVYHRNAWINVWDGQVQLNAAGRPDPSTMVPGVLPPTSVRQLSPDPGPFAHPRLYCTPFDWAEINARCVQGKVKLASAAWPAVLGRAKTFIEGKSPNQALYRDLEAWATANFAGKAPDLVAGVGLSKAPVNSWGNPEIKKIEGRLISIAQDLLFTGFSQWARLDPALPWKEIPLQEQVVCRRVAMVLAAFCKSHLDANWTAGDERNPRGTFNKDYVGFSLNEGDGPPRYEDFWRSLALTYDFIAPWMTPSEQRAARSLLFAAGAGHFTWRTAKGGPGWTFSGNWRGVSGGGGTFSNFGEHVTFLTAAVAGEESGVEPVVLRAFGQPLAMDADPFTNPRDPYPESLAWPHARKSDVHNLIRQVYAMRDILSPNGFYGWGEEEAYGLFWPLYIYPASVGLLRQGAHNQFITGPNYRVVNHILYSLYPSSKPDGSYTSIPRHSGNGDHRYIATLFLKYFYPDDPAVGLIHSLRHGIATDSTGSPVRRIPFETCIFGMDPLTPHIGPNALEKVATVKGLPLTKIDRLFGRAILRSDWSDSALMADLDAMPGYGGHATYAGNAFSLLALGRSWSLQPGYHKVYSTWHSGISILNPEWASCPMTKGFVGINRFYLPTGMDPTKLEKPGGAKLLETSESPDGFWSVAVSDATACYNTKTDNGAPFEPTTIQHAIRTLLVVRGKRPYAFVVDDLRKDDQPHTWRWTMNNTERVGDNNSPFAMDLLSGATATEGVLAHQRDLGNGGGLPRLLVRDLSENDQSKQPAMVMDQTKFTAPKGQENDFYLNHQVNLLVLERQQVVEPRFTVLLFPFRTGEPLPTTIWNQDRSELTVDHRNGTVDTLRFTRATSGPRTQISVQRK